MIAHGQDPRAAGTARMPAAPGPDAAITIRRTFGDVLTEFINQRQHEWSNAKHAAQWRSSLENHAGTIMRLPVDAISKVHVLGALDVIWATLPETSRRVRGRIERVLDFAEARGYRDDNNPARWKGKLENALSGKRTSQGHFAAIPVLDAPSGFAAIWARREEGQGAAVLVATILGAHRSGEARGLAWSEYDAATATLVIPAERMKAKRQHRVAISNLYAQHIEAQPKWLNCPYIFPSSRMGVISDMTMTATMKRVGLAAYTPHGWRSTFADWATGRGFSRELIEDGLAHTVGSSVERAYRRSDWLEARRPMMEAWSEFLVSEVGRNSIIH